MQIFSFLFLITIIRLGGISADAKYENARLCWEKGAELRALATSLNVQSAVGGQIDLVIIRNCRFC